MTRLIVASWNLSRLVKNVLKCLKGTILQLATTRNEDVLTLNATKYRGTTKKSLERIPFYTEVVS